MSISQVTVHSKIGPWVIEGDDDGLTQIYMPTRTTSPIATSTHQLVARAGRQLTEYFEGRRRYFDVDLHLVGTDFQQTVWLSLTDIPYGEVRSYGDVAIAIGHPLAYRAVGNANGNNPWPIFIPCHRVVSSTGIGGYTGGLDVKRFLLDLEASHCPSSRRKY